MYAIKDTIYIKGTKSLISLYALLVLFEIPYGRVYKRTSLYFESVVVRYLNQFWLLCPAYSEAF